MADYTIAVIGERLSALVEEQAPTVRLHIRVVRESLASEADETIRRIDGIVAPPLTSLMLPHIRSTELFRDRWVCVCWQGNRTLNGSTPVLADLARLAWVAPYLPDRGRTSSAPLLAQLAMLGIQPHVAVRVESYQAAPYFITGTDRVALMQARLAERLAALLDLRVMDCPGASEAIVETLWWCEDYDDDPAHRWLRQNLQVLAAEV
jgi:DNA-binding transcriptional LysR family regulator